jgi:hypothetical protein
LTQIQTVSQDVTPDYLKDLRTEMFENLLNPTGVMIEVSYVTLVQPVVLVLEL